MKIAFVVHDYHRTGGHSRYVVELAERFSADHEVHVFANRFEPSSSAKIVFHRVPAWRASALTTILTFIPPASMKINGDFDVVHAQGLSCLGANVVTAHICNSAWFKVFRENGISGGNRVFETLVCAFERRLYRNSRGSAVVAVSKLVQRDLESFYGRSDNVEVIHHGVDLNQFSPQVRSRYRDEMRAKLGIAESEVAFLFVGDLRKGADAAIQALASLGEGRLLFVSRTDPHDYQKLAGRLGVARRVNLSPATEQIERWYAAADALLFPTAYDAFGMVISEAMASGLPVITSRMAGAAELIDHPENGILLDDPFDVREIADRMRELVLNPAKRTDIGKAAAEKIQPYSWDSVADRTMQFYQRVLTEHRV